MKSILRPVVNTIGICLFCSLISLETSAAPHSATSGSDKHPVVAPDSMILKTVDTILVAPDFKILLQADDTQLRFHFTITKKGSADILSAGLVADFSVNKGFVAAYDATRVALLVVDKIKSGTANPGITKAELTSNNIPQQ